MILHLAAVAAVLVAGNVLFRHFDPLLPIWKRFAKSTVALCVTTTVSFYFGGKGVLIAAGIVALPLLYVHGIWLPRHGVNGWTGEPRERYHALRGWPPPDNLR